MTRDLKRLQTIEALFSTRESAAGSELAGYERTLVDAQEQLQVLRTYRDGYLNHSNAGPGASAGHYQNHASFMRRLNEAISQQEETVQLARVDRDAVLQRYRLCRQRTMAVGKAHGKRLANHRQDVDRREQKEMDQWRPPSQDSDN